MSQYEIELQRGPMARRAMEYLTDPALRADLGPMPPTALQTFLGAAQRSGSLEEIEIVLRYQQAREPRSWTQKLVEQILKDLREAAKLATAPGMSETESDRLKVNAAAQQLSLIVRVHKVASAALPRAQDRNRNER